MIGLPQHYHAQMDGQQVVPPVLTPGTGSLTLRVIHYPKPPTKKPEEGKIHRLTWNMKINHLKKITKAHLHLGALHQAAGDVVVTLFDLGKHPASGTYTTYGRISDKNLEGPLKGKQLQDLLKLMEEGKINVNVHTEDHPDGEIRGQLVAEEIKKQPKPSSGKPPCPMPEKLPCPMPEKPPCPMPEKPPCPMPEKPPCPMPEKPPCPMPEKPPCPMPEKPPCPMPEKPPCPMPEKPPPPPEKSPATPIKPPAPPKKHPKPPKKHPKPPKKSHPKPPKKTPYTPPKPPYAPPKPPYTPPKPPDTPPCPMPEKPPCTPSNIRIVTTKTGFKVYLN